MTQLQFKRDLAQAIYDCNVCGHDFVREASCFVAEGMGVVAMSTQHLGGHVDFDFFRIWGAMKAAPKMPKIVRMYHTHAPGCYYASTTDNNAVKGWATALGMPVEMVIVSDISPMRYMCSKGNVITDLGRFCSSGAERFMILALSGISLCEDQPTQEELDGITVELNRIVPVETWS